MAKTKKPADADIPETENAAETPQEAQEAPPVTDAPENPDIAATDENSGGTDEAEQEDTPPDADTPQETAPEDAPAPEDETAPAPANDDAQPAPEQFTEQPLGAFSTAPLLLGGRMWRKSWAPGRTVVLESVGGRGGVKPTMMLTGARSGNLPWDTAKHDDLLASDWICAMPKGLGSGQAN